MSTIQIRVDDKLKADAYAVFNEIDVSPSEAMRMLLQYVAENKKLPFSPVSLIVSNIDSDDDIIEIVKRRLARPGKRIRVNIDDI